MKIPEGWKLVHTIPVMFEGMKETNTYQNGAFKIGISENNDAFAKIINKKYHVSLSENSKPLTGPKADAIFSEWGFISAEMAMEPVSYSSQWFANLKEERETQQQR